MRASGGTYSLVTQLLIVIFLNKVIHHYSTPPLKLKSCDHSYVVVVRQSSPLKGGTLKLIIDSFACFTLSVA